MYYILIILLVIVDQFTKSSIRDLLGVGGSIPIIKNVFNLTYIQNRGAAFGMLQDKQWFFIIVGIFAIIIGVSFLRKSSYGKIEKCAISLIMAGALGNIIDRVKDGFVTDFFDFHFIWSYIFNVADIYIVVGVFVFMMITILKGDDLNKKA